MLELLKFRYYPNVNYASVAMDDCAAAANYCNAIVGAIPGKKN